MKSVLIFGSATLLSALSSACIHGQSPIQQSNTEVNNAENVASKFDKPQLDKQELSKTAHLSHELSADFLTIKIGEQVVLRYNIAIQEPPVGLDPVYRRNGYIHPIMTPSGRVVTGDFSGDHPHQRGFFMAWVKTEFRDHAVDFWNLQRKTGRVRFSRVLEINESDNHLDFSIENLHQDTTDPDNPVDVIREIWHVRVYSRSDGCHVFDVKSEQTLIADAPLKLKRHIYGGLGIRGNSDWVRAEAEQIFADWDKEYAAAKASASGDEILPPPTIDVMGCEYLTSEGKQRHDGNHTTARWADIYGLVDGEFAGLTVLGHPDNFRFPQAVRLHPFMPYFSFAPPVAGEFEISPNETYVSKFRVLAHDGKPDVEAIERQWNDYKNTKED